MKCRFGYCNALYFAPDDRWHHHVAQQLRLLEVRYQLGEVSIGLSDT